MKRGFLSTKRVTKHVTGSDENPCFSFVLLVYNESFSRSFILVEEEILLELFISKIHSLEPYHILDQIKNYLDSSHHNELPKTKLVMMTGHIIVE